MQEKSVNRIYWTDYHDFFHQMKGICVTFVDSAYFPISQGTLPWQPILGKIGEITLIQHTGVSKRIPISQF